MKRKRITRRNNSHNDRMMALTKKINDRKRLLTASEQVEFNIKFAFKHPELQNLRS